MSIESLNYNEINDKKQENKEIKTYSPNLTWREQLKIDEANDKKNEWPAENILKQLDENTDKKIPEPKEKIKEIEQDWDINELINKAINQTIQNILEDIDSKEGIDFSKEWIYNNVMENIQEIKNKLEDNNKFKDDLSAVINNILLPQEKWIENISFLIEENLKNNNKEYIDINHWNIDWYLSLMKWSLWTIYDIAKNSNKSELNRYLSDIKQIWGIEKIFNNFPDLENIIFNLLPDLAKNTDKYKFISSINQLFNNISWDLANFWEYINWNSDISKEILDNSKLNIINNSSIFLKNVLNSETVDIIWKKAWEMEIFKSNDITNSILEIINWWHISKDDKLKLTNKVLEWVDIFSNKESNDKQISDYINDLIWSLSNISKDVPKDKIINLFNKITWNTDKLSENEDEEIDINFRKLADFLRENKGHLVEIAWDLIEKFYNNPDQSLKSLIIELLQNDSFKELAEKKQWKWFIDELFWIINKDVNWNELKNEFKWIISWYNLDFENINKENRKKIDKIESDFVNILWDWIKDDIKYIVINKIKSNNDNNLTKSDIINIINTNVKETINNNKEKIYEYIENAWIKLETIEDRNNIINIINKITDNPRFNTIIEKFIDNITGKLNGSDDIIWELDKLIKDTAKSWWIEHFDNTQEDIKKISIDTVYDDILSNEWSINTIISIMENKTWEEIEINWENIKEVSDILKEYITKDELKEVLKDYNIAEIKNNIKEIWIKLYNKVENKNELINKIIDSKTIEKIQSTPTSKEKLKEEDINISIDLIYKTLQESNNKEISNTINKIIKKQWLEELQNIKILWQSFWENITDILNSINKEDLKQILNQNLDNINKLNIIWEQVNQDEKYNIISTIWIELYEKIDIDKFKEGIDKNKLNNNEKIILDLSDELQWEISQLKELNTKTNDIYKIYSWEIPIDKINPESIKNYGTKVFDLFNSVITKIDNKYLAENIKLADKWEKNEAIETFISSFISENKWFITKEAISWLITWYSAWKSIDTYFRNKENNRENFWDTLYNFLKKKNT